MEVMELVVLLLIGYHVSKVYSVKRNTIYYDNADDIIKGGNMLYTPNDTLDDPYLMPIIANGYVGTVILDGI